MDFKYEIVRSPRRKTVCISISPQNEISVTVPLRLSLKQIEEIVREKARWIHKKLKDNEEIQSALKPKRYANGENFLFLGKEYPLRILEGEAERFFLLDDGFYVEVIAGMKKDQKKTHLKSLLHDWYQQQADKIIRERVAIYQKHIQKKPKKITIKSMKTRWGSCTSLDNISFHWKIIMAPLKIVDYLVVHELCHLMYLDHSKRYWNLVKSILPDCMESRKWLRDHGNTLEL